MPTMASAEHQHDVAIVGAGPIGLELAVSLKHLGVDYVHLEAKQIGQTISWYPRNAQFFSSPERIAIAGLPLTTSDQSKATGEQYLAYLRGVVEAYDLTINTYEPVDAVERDGDASVLTTPKAAYRVNKLVLAIGDMYGPRRCGYPGEDLPHVSHYFVEPHRYFRQRLLIVGGRNSAVEAALRCYRAGAQVSVSYRRAAFDEKSIKYWLLPEIKALIKAGKIAFHPQTVPIEIHAGCTLLGAVDPDSGDACALASAAQDQPVRVDNDFVLMLTGYVQDPKLFEMAGVALDGENHAPQYDPDTMQTNVPGVYVAGTAAAGTQHRFKLFIENSHPHVVKIVKAITGSPPPAHLVNPVAQQFALPES